MLKYKILTKKYNCGIIFYIGDDAMLAIGDKVVYPMHGAGVIEAIEEHEVLGERQNYYILSMSLNQFLIVPTYFHLSN